MSIEHHGQDHRHHGQVLQMSMAIDDHDSADLKIDFSARNHVFDPAFNLDSVSYITHETSTSKLQAQTTDREWMILDDTMMRTGWYVLSSGGSPTSDAGLPPSHSTFRAATVTGILRKRRRKRNKSSLVKIKMFYENTCRAPSCEEPLWASAILGGSVTWGPHPCL